MYAARIGKRSRLMTVSLPKRLADLLVEYSSLSGGLRSHTYARLLRADLLVCLTSERALFDRLETADAEPRRLLNHAVKAELAVLHEQDDFYLEDLVEELETLTRKYEKEKDEHP